MKRFFNTIQNIFKIEELRSRILLTLGYILIYRLGAHIVLPGVNPQMLSALSKQTQEGVLGLLDMFSGGKNIPTMLKEEVKPWVLKVKF
mgnify:CR=1 FL=1